VAAAAPTGSHANSQENGGWAMLRSSTPNSGIFGLFSRIFHFFSVIFHTNTGKWVSEIVKAFDIFDMHLVTTCAHASCISSQGDVAAPDIFAWACHMTSCRQSYEEIILILAPHLSPCPATGDDCKFRRRRPARLILVENTKSGFITLTT